MTIKKVVTIGIVVGLLLAVGLFRLMPPEPASGFEIQGMPFTVIVSFAQGGIVSFMPGTNFLISVGFSNAGVTMIGLGSMVPGSNQPFLTSYGGPQWRGAPLTSTFIVLASNSLQSTTLVAGVAGAQIVVYEWDIALQSAAVSVGFYSGSIGAPAVLRSHWVSEYGAQGGIAKNAIGGTPEPFERFRTDLGSSLWWIVGEDIGETNRSRVNILWSLR